MFNPTFLTKDGFLGDTSIFGGARPPRRREGVTPPPVKDNPNLHANNGIFGGPSLFGTTRPHVVNGIPLALAKDNPNCQAINTIFGDPSTSGLPQFNGLFNYNPNINAGRNMYVSLFSDGPCDPRSSTGKQFLNKHIGNMRLIQRSREACWELSSKALKTFPQEILDMIYHELVKSCQGVDEDGNFEIVLKPQAPTERWCNEIVGMLKPCNEKLYGKNWNRERTAPGQIFGPLIESPSNKDAVTWPLSHQDLRGKYAFLHDGYMPPVMQRDIILTLLDRGTLWLPDFESFEVVTLTSRIFAGLGRHLHINPYEHISQITVPWAMKTLFSEIRKPHHRRTYTPSNGSQDAVERELMRVLNYNFKKGLKIKVLVDQYLARYMHPTQGTVQQLKAKGLHIQWEFQPEVAQRTRGEGEDRPTQRMSPFFGPLN